MRLRVSVAVLCLLGAAPSHAAPNAALQNLKWFVVQGIGNGENLAFYQDVIDRATAEAKLLLQGDQGPADVPCCVDLHRIAITQVALATLQDVDSASDYNDMLNICNQQGGGSCAFLVDTVSYCNGFAPNLRGCSDNPSCASNLPGDDPTLTLVVSLDALADGTLAETIAHERGHNACLAHVAASPCQLMQAASGGGCLDATECGHYRDAGNAVGGACQCQTDALATVSDGSRCTEVAGGMCSGGVCAPEGSDASLPLLAAGGLENTSDAATTHPLRVSGLTGGWTDRGSFAGATQVTGLEYAPKRDLVYGVTAADELISIDPVSGAQLAVLGTLPTSAAFPSLGIQPVRYDGLAYDPGPTAALGDDLLYAVRQPESCSDQDFCKSQLVSIDPDTTAATLLGDLDTSFLGGVQELAYDSVRQHLYASASAQVSIWEIDLGCPFQFCSVLDVAGDPRTKASLAYSAFTDRLYEIGTRDDGTVLYDSFDAATFEHDESIGIDGFTPGGLAAPEPGALAAALAAAAALAVLAGLTRSGRGTPRRRRRAARRGC